MLEGRNLKQPRLHATLPRRLVNNSTHMLIFENFDFIQICHYDTLRFGALMLSILLVTKPSMCSQTL